MAIVNAMIRVYCSALTVWILINLFAVEIGYSTSDT